MLFHQFVLSLLGTDVYEQRPEKKLRAPAWCDRILYYCSNNSSGTKSCRHHHTNSSHTREHFYPYPYPYPFHFMPIPTIPS
ncbi:hypothetical protein EON63_14010 [archaeon]|nr:MAG: hypothetical protein EON63_14010 [archaeon]